MYTNEESGHWKQVAQSAEFTKIDELQASAEAMAHQLALRNATEDGPGEDFEAIRKNLLERSGEQRMKTEETNKAKAHTIGVKCAPPPPPPRGHFLNLAPGLSELEILLERNRFCSRQLVFGVEASTWAPHVRVLIHWTT